MMMLTNIRLALKNSIRIWLLWMLVFIPSPLQAADPPKVLLLNSDASVKKYQVVQQEFLKSFSRPVKTVDLSTESTDKRSGMIVRKDENLIFCIGARAYQMVYEQNPKTDIVFSSILNWRRLPLRDRTYGISNELHGTMQMMVFRYIFPNIRKLGVIYSEQFTRQTYVESRQEASEMGIELIGRPIRDEKETLSVLSDLLSDVDALWLIPDPIILKGKSSLIALLNECEKHRIPVFSYNDVFAKYGAVLIVSTDDATVGRQAAGIAEELLSGRQPRHTIQFPAGSQVTLNLKKVQSLGLKYSSDAFSIVNKIIE